MFTFGILVQTNEQILITVLENALFTWQAIQVEKRPFFCKVHRYNLPFLLGYFWLLLPPGNMCHSQNLVLTSSTKRIENRFDSIAIYFSWQQSLNEQHDHILPNRSSHLGIHKQRNACWSIPRSQTVLYHFKICRKWELWSLCYGPLLPF